MHHFCKRLLRARRGATAIEYGLILACIAMSLIVTFQYLNGQTGNLFGSSTNAVSNASN